MPEWGLKGMTPDDRAPERAANATTKILRLVILSLQSLAIMCLVVFLLITDSGKPERFLTFALATVSCALITGVMFYSLWTLHKRPGAFAEPTRDEVTGLWDYRTLDRMLDEHLRHALASWERLSFLYVDLDNFKRVNDEHDHQIGNKVLGSVGELILSTIRSTDVAGRIGGDEFAIITPSSAKSQAMILAERLRKAIEGASFKPGPGITVDYVRMSIGVAEFPTDVADKESLIQAADQAMYRAKQGGGNRTAI